MKVKAMGYPAKNYNFNTEKEVKALTQGAEHKGMFGEGRRGASVKKMYGNKKFTGKRKV